MALSRSKVVFRGVVFLWIMWAVVLLILLLSSISHAADARFSWLPNSEKDLAGYRIHYGDAPGQYSKVVDVGLPATQSDGRVHYAIEGVSSEPAYFAATAYDKAGNESSFSDEEDVDLPPGAVGGFSKVTVEVKVTVNDGGAQ